MGKNNQNILTPLHAGVTIQFNCGSMCEIIIGPGEASEISAYMPALIKQWKN
jgi:hypothetical protein